MVEHGTACTRRQPTCSRDTKKILTPIHHALADLGKKMLLQRSGLPMSQMYPAVVPFSHLKLGEAPQIPILKAIIPQKSGLRQTIGPVQYAPATLRDEFAQGVLTLEVELRIGHPVGLLSALSECTGKMGGVSARVRAWKEYVCNTRGTHAPMNSSKYDRMGLRRSSGCPQ